MGTVYLAEHVSIQKAFALKVLSPGLAKHKDLAARFLQEARLASRIDHENMVDISDFGQTEDGLYYFVMEYVDGQNLDATVKTSGPLPWQRVHPIMLQITSVLQAAHDKGIVHRDMKPANVILCRRQGRQDFVKVLDFGVAKLLDSTKAKLVTTDREIEVLGTPLYMAPEQCHGDPVDGRTDVYACGCLLYHLLTGRPPFEGTTQFSVVLKQMSEAPAPPSSRLGPGALPAEVDAIVLKALAKNPADRWQSMRAMGAAIEATLGSTGDSAVQREAASPVPGPGQPWVDGASPTISVVAPSLRGAVPSSGPARRRRLRRALVGCGLTMALLAGAAVLRFGPRHDRSGSLTPGDAVSSPSEAGRLQPASPPRAAAADALPPGPVPSLSPVEQASPPTSEPRAAGQRKRPAGPTRAQRQRQPVFEPLADPALE